MVIIIAPVSKATSIKVFFMCLYLVKIIISGPKLINKFHVSY